MLALILIAACMGPASAEFFLPSFSTPQPNCNSCIDGICYATTTFAYDGVYLRTMTGIPAFDLTENILYFTEEEISYYTIIPKDIKNYLSKRKVPGIPSFTTGSTVDRCTRELYVWMQHSDAHNGYPSYLKNCSFVYNPVKERTEDFCATDEAIKEMHFKGKLYFTLKFRNGLFAYKYVSPESIPAFDNYNISQFVVDRLENIYATTEDGVYRLQKGADQVTLVTPKNYSVSVDKDENVYFMDPVDKTVLKLDYYMENEK